MDQISDTPSDGARPGHDRFKTLVAVGIVVVSVAGALVAWQAAVRANEASDLDQAGLQQLVQRQQREADLESLVVQDFRLFGPYQQHVLMWRILQRQADEVRTDDPDLAGELEGQARSELTLARTLAAQFPSTTPALPGSDLDGIVEFDAEFVIESFKAEDQELVGLRPEETFAQADRAHREAVQLVGVAVVLAAALFFLTLAELTRRGVRGVFATAGALVTLLGIVLAVSEVVGS
jgi:hypothetical protein